MSYSEIEDWVTPSNGAMGHASHDLCARAALTIERPRVQSQSPEAEEAEAASQTTTHTLAENCAAYGTTFLPSLQISIPARMASRALLCASARPHLRAPRYDPKCVAISSKVVCCLQSRRVGHAPNASASGWRLHRQWPESRRAARPMSMSQSAATATYALLGLGRPSSRVARKPTSRATR